MKKGLQESSKVEVYPATAERWKDIESLFGEKGAYAGCWCMFWRLDRADFKKMKGEGTKVVLKGMTTSNDVAGLLAYVGGQPIGWCSIGPSKRRCLIPPTSPHHPRQGAPQRCYATGNASGWALNPHAL